MLLYFHLSFQTSIVQLVHRLQQKLVLLMSCSPKEVTTTTFQNLSKYLNIYKSNIVVVFQTMEYKQEQLLPPYHRLGIDFPQLRPTLWVVC